MYQLHLQNFSLNSIYIKINYSFEHLECGTNHFRKGGEIDSRDIDQGE